MNGAIWRRAEVGGENGRPCLSPKARSGYSDAFRTFIKQGCCGAMRNCLFVWVDLSGGLFTLPLATECCWGS